MDSVSWFEMEIKGNIRMDLLRDQINDEMIWMELIK